MNDELDYLLGFYSDGNEIFEEGELYYGWEAQKNIRISYYSDDLVSMESSYYEYTGGVHGNSYTSSENYSFENGRWIEAGLDDLFYPEKDYFGFLSSYVYEDLKEQGASNVTDGFYTELGRDDLCEFTISPMGLEFIFSPYHMGCYAEGYYYVLVLFSELKPYITRNSLLDRFTD
jgi:hypothetical protein